MLETPAEGSEDSDKRGWVRNGWDSNGLPPAVCEEALP